MNQSVQELFSTIHRPMITLLQRHAPAGRTISEKGLSDLSIDDRKICGSSLYLGNHPDLYYYQSSLMVESDPTLIERYLQHPPREPDYRGGRSHRDFCTTMRVEGWSCSGAEVAALFNKELQPVLDA
jgi:lipoate-protein ligase A